MRCRYCELFVISKDRFGDEGHFCPATKKVVNRDDKSCEQFEMHPRFYCDSDSCQMDLVVCIARQNKQKEGCHKCGQGEMLYGFVSLRNKEA
jgi:hypothetical protein